MIKLKEFIDNNKAAAILLLLTIIAFLTGILFCIITNLENKNIEKKTTEENMYSMYFKEQSLIKITFKETFSKCGNTVCSKYSDVVQSFELLNDHSKNLYKNINLKNKDLNEAIAILLNEAKNNNYVINSLELVTNWESRYTEEEFKNLLKEYTKEVPTFPINFIYQNTINEENLINNIFKPSYTITFDSNFGTNVEPQVVFENELAIEPKAPTRDGYDFIKWQHDDGKPFNFNTKITKNYTLKASWKKKPTVSTIQTTSPTTTNTSNTEKPTSTTTEPTTTTTKPVESNNPDNNETDNNEDNE